MTRILGGPVRRMTWLVLLGLFPGVGASPSAGLHAAPIVELVAKGTPFQGNPIAHNNALCWLVSPDGSQRRVDLSQVTAHRLLPGEFRHLTPGEVANELSRDLAPGREVEVRGAFVVVAPQGRARLFAGLLDTTTKSFYGYFSRRSMFLDPAGFALVVDVHDSKPEFDKHCQADGMPVSPLLRGYYSPQSNRVVMFDGRDPSTDAATGSSPRGRSSGDALDPTVRDTVAHEVVHQLAFNTGLHSRIGRNPRWVVEGLATVLEAEGFLNGRSTGSGSPVNQERLDWFRDAAKAGRLTSVAEFVTNDERLFAANVLDFYAQAWALSYYLMETRPGDYRAYLQRLSARNPLAADYPALDRLADFQAVFGNDVRLLESRFLRFVDGLP